MFAASFIPFILAYFHVLEKDFFCFFHFFIVFMFFVFSFCILSPKK